MRRRPRLVGLLLVLAFVVAACSDGRGSSSTTTSASTTSLVATSSSTAASAATSSTATTAPKSATDLGDFPQYSNDGPSGSGCSPGGDTLPTGWWFGHLSGAMTGPVARFDLMCFFIGDAAVKAAIADGNKDAQQNGSVDNDYWIRNETNQLRNVPIATAVATLCVGTDGADAKPCPRDKVGQTFNVWLRVNGGQVDRAVEQFLP